MGGGGKGKGVSGGSAPSTQNQFLNQNLPTMIHQLSGLTNQEMGYINAPADQQGSLANLIQGGAQMSQDPASGVSPVQQEVTNIGNAQGLAPQFQDNANWANLLAKIGLSQEQTAYGQEQGAQAQTRSLEQGTGLYPSQEAYITQAVESGQAAVQQQLASEGLSSSTQDAMLKDQVAQSGAATAGQLIQGNIQLSQSQQQLDQQAMQQGGALALGGAGLAEQDLGQLQNLWQTAANQWGTMQQQGFEQALQGTGMIGQFFQGAAQPYGYQLQAYNQLLQETISGAQVQANMMQAEQSAQAQGSSSLLGSLGSLFGGGGSSSGLSSLIGGVGGLFGGGASLAAGTGLGVSAAAGTAAGGAIADAAGLAFGAV